jgi:hypothetical protein
VAVVAILAVTSEMMGNSLGWWWEVAWLEGASKEEPVVGLQGMKAQVTVGNRLKGSVIGTNKVETVATACRLEVVV